MAAAVICGHPVQNMRQRPGNIRCFFRTRPQPLIRSLQIRDKEQFHLKNIRIFQIPPYKVKAHAPERNPPLQGRSAHPHLLPEISGRNTEHVAFRKHMIFDKFHIPDSLIGCLIILSTRRKVFSVRGFSPPSIS